ncbi:MAG: lysophospholipid acyltransferase family protein [Paludibacter sp.]|jgi:KDO2-lipid IV(A) lauroyltransferase|nr:lysophospholipid acyltransferase family protein [Paludibacter sp.]
MFYILKIVFFLVAMFPLGALYVLSDMLYPVVYHIVKYRRKVVCHNLALAFPEKSSTERLIIEKKFYRFFCDLFVEIIKFSSISEKTLRKHLSFSNVAAISEILDREQSVMLMAAHYGNWEWGAAFRLFVGKQYNVCNIYKKLNDKHFMNLMNKIRGRFGSVNVEMKTLLREMLRLKNAAQPTVFFMIADQRPTQRKTYHRLKFLGCDTSVITGTEELARRFDYPVVYVCVNRLKRGFYDISFNRITEQPTELCEFEITEKYFAFLEERIREKPEFWLWTHNRWRF